MILGSLWLRGHRDPEALEAMWRIGGPTFVVFMLVFMYGGMAFILWRRKKPQPPRRPDGLPQAAVPVRISTLIIEHAIGTDEGWMYSDHGFLVFLGQEIAFRIRTIDLAKPPKLRANGRLELKLALGKQLADIGVSISPFSRKEPARFEAIVQDWRNAAEPAGESLLPPVRYAYEFINPIRAVLSFLPVAAMVGIATFVTTRILSDLLAETHLDHLGLMPAVMFAILLVFPGLALTHEPSLRMREKRIDKLAEKEDPASGTS